MPTTIGETEVRECIDGVARAIRAKDLDALMGHYAHDVVVFDLMPLRTLGAESYRRNFEAWFGSVEGPIGYEVKELGITAREDVAVGHYTGRVVCTRMSGARADYQVRVTAGLRKLRGRWLITHEHISLPFTSREAMQAALES